MTPPPAPATLKKKKNQLVALNCPICLAALKSSPCMPPLNLSVLTLSIFLVYDVTTCLHEFSDVYTHTHGQLYMMISIHNNSRCQRVNQMIKTLCWTRWCVDSFSDGWKANVPFEAQPSVARLIWSLVILGAGPGDVQNIHICQQDPPTCSHQCCNLPSPVLQPAQAIPR